MGSGVVCVCVRVCVRPRLLYTQVTLTVRVYSFTVVESLLLSRPLRAKRQKVKFEGLGLTK